MQKRKPMSLRQKKSLQGYVFLIPLIIGLVYLFIIPIISSFIFSISNATGSAYGIKIIGFKAYDEALNVHTSYRQTVVEAILQVLKTTPIIMLYSFLMASILNQEFKGKTFFRVMLFLPAVTTLVRNISNNLEYRMGVYYSGYKDTVNETSESVVWQFSDYMQQVGLGDDAVEIVRGIFDLLYSVVDDCSIQMLIIFIGMQAIAPALYEAAHVEGATGWESFWFITFPMVSPMLLVCVIYTIVDSFTTTSSGVMSLISTTTFENINIALGAAMGWIYFLIIGIILVIVGFVFSKLVFYYDK